MLHDALRYVNFGTLATLLDTVKVPAYWKTP